ncbi:MAG: AraC family transcriptional regulator ligand-binding domain-containing protein [Pseudomonadota bacterium]
MTPDPQMRYKVARTTLQLCGLLNIDPHAILRRLRRPADYYENEGRGVTAFEYFDGWNAILAEANRPDTPLILGRAYARGPFNPAFFAFTCSPTVAIGLERLALFKPLTGPLHLSMRRDETDALYVSKSTNIPGLPLPPSFSATEAVFFAEAIRSCTGAHVVPQAVTITGPVDCMAEIEAYLGCEVRVGSHSTWTLSAQDADRPLLSADPEQWAALEPGFRRQIALQRAGQSITARLRAALAEMLPAGEAQIQDAASRLRLSVRSLQRHLRDESTSFQSELDSMREMLARHYLSKTDLRVDEISYLLAYRDPNSFYRAFQGWTGLSPGALRSAQTAAVGS